MASVTKILWTLRSSIATLTETLPQNITLIYRKSFAILSSRSCCIIMRSKDSTNKLARSGFRVQMENKGLHLYSHKFHRAPMAQLVEHRAVTREVVSSTQGL